MVALEADASRLFYLGPLEGPVPGIKFEVRLFFYSHLDDLAVWDTDLWNDPGAVWEGASVPTEVGCEVLSISVQRGRDEALSRFEPGTAVVEVNDPDGLLSPWGSAANPSGYNAIRPGIPIDIRAHDTTSGIYYPVYRGIVNAIVDTFPNTIGHSVTFSAVDALSYLAAFNGTEGPSVGTHELSGARIARILALVQYPEARNLDTGRVRMQPTTLALNALDMATDVVTSELGALFVDAAGVLQFVDSNGIVSEPHYTQVQYVFGDDPEGDELCYDDILLATDASIIRNVISVSRNGGTVTTVVDYASTGLYGYSTYERTDLPHEDDAESATIANAFLNAFADTARRIEEITVLPHVHSNLVLPVLSIGLLWRIQVRRRAQGFQVVADLQVESIAHEITAREWSVTYSTFDAANVFAAGQWQVANWDSGLWAY